MRYANTVQVYLVHRLTGTLTSGPIKHWPWVAMADTYARIAIHLPRRARAVV